MSDVNTFVFSGRIARAPEVRQTPSGVQVADFTVANNLYRRNSPEKTTFFRCVAWSGIAKYVSGMGVGDAVHVQGELVDDNYTPQGTDKPTKGRLKIDNCKVQLLRRKTKTEETAEKQDDIPVIPDVAETPAQAEAQA